MKLLIINLKSSTERRLAVETQLSKLGISNYEFIEAVVGNDLDDDIIDKKVSKRILFNYLNRTKPLSKTEAGCALSHIKAYKRCLDIGERCIIFEDDAIITNTFKDIINMNLDEKYDIIYLGYRLNRDDFSGDRILETYHHVKDTFYRPVTNNIIYDKFYKLEFKHIMVYGTHAYSPSLSMCKKMVNSYKEKVIAPSDIFLNLMCSNIYCPLDRYVYSNREIESTIGDRNER